MAVLKCSGHMRKGLFTTLSLTDERGLFALSKIHAKTSCSALFLTREKQEERGKRREKREEKRT
jgi:hypothetical protein